MSYYIIKDDYIGHKLFYCIFYLYYTVFTIGIRKLQDLQVTPIIYEGLHLFSVPIQIY